MSLIEQCARALHRRDVDDPACEPERREWDHLTVELQDEYRADARAVLDAANHQGVVDLTDAERKRVLWWLHRPVPPGPMKELDVAIIRKFTGGSR
jgi:hypothetical protein